MRLKWKCFLCSNVFVMYVIKFYFQTFSINDAILLNNKQKELSSKAQDKQSQINTLEQ